jgi:Tol biopolymer transport system component
MSADGRFVVLIAWASEGGTFAWRLFLRDRLAGTTTRLLEEISADILCAAISADGAHLAFLADGLVLPELEAPAPWQAYVLDVETGSIIPASRGPSGWSMVSVDGISISDGGRYIAYGAGGDLADDAPEGSHQFYRFDRMTGEITRVSNGVSGPLTGLVSSFPATAISADGRTIAFRVMENGFAPSDDNGFSDIVVVRVDGLPGDLDADGDVDAIDLSILISRWGTHGAEGGGNADLDGDGEVGPIDLATLLAAWR